jgi:uncharacterized membrane protein
MTILQNQEKHSRSIAKAVSWRVTGTIDTFIISAIVTGRLGVAGSIAATELFTKIGLYYFHERIWAAVPWGRK